MSNRSPRLSFALLGGVLWAAAAIGPALAQSTQMQELLNRIQRLQQELTTLQGHVYRGTQPPAGDAPAPMAAPGNEAGGPVVARLSVRIVQLDSEIRRLTGQNEEYGHVLRQLQARMDKLVTDVDARLAALERRAGPPAGAEPATPDADAAGAAAPPPAPPGTAAPGPAPGPQVLGQLRVDPATGKPLPPPAGGAAPQQASAPTETAEQLYERAQTLLLKEQNVAEAEKVLHAFLQAHPRHSLAPNAHYWLGRTYFVRKDYQQAAFTFAEGFQKYPKSDKAAANLLNLGMSLARLDKTREACTAFQRLTQNFPDADAAIKHRVASEYQRAKCR